jgi:NAD-dependent deacetylase
MDSEQSRLIYWKMEQEFYELVLSVRPNAIHDACVELEQYHKLYAIITQNVDSLHQRAGTSPSLVIEIHGNIFSVTCQNCSRKYSREDIYYRIKNGVKIPYCDYCGGILKSDTVAFGQPMPRFESCQSLKVTYASDLFIVIGCSLLVQPAAYLIVKAKESHSRVILINLISTPYDNYADLIIYENAERAITKIMESVRKKMP